MGRLQELGRQRRDVPQERLDLARHEAEQGNVAEAVAILRSALQLAPRDAEIAEMLGRLAFKDRVVAR